jgi:hypothetical protein
VKILRGCSGRPLIDTLLGNGTRSTLGRVAATVANTGPRSDGEAGAGRLSPRVGARGVVFPKVAGAAVATAVATAAAIAAPPEK